MNVNMQIMIMVGNKWCLFVLFFSPVIVFHSENPAGDAIVHKSSDVL